MSHPPHALDSTRVLDGAFAYPIYPSLLTLNAPYNTALSQMERLMSSQAERLPLLPLNALLFPQGRLTLRLSAPRDLDMVGGCMKENRSFGICLADPENEGVHKVGVEALIVDWDMSQAGHLSLTVRGGRRFHVLETEPDELGRLNGTVAWFEATPEEMVSEAHQDILPLLAVMLKDARLAVPQPHRLDDATWVGYRYAEALPIPMLARQRLLELEDPDLRLAIIREYLVGHGLIEAGD